MPKSIFNIDKYSNSSYGFRGVDGLKLEYFKKNGLVPNWIFDEVEAAGFDVMPFTKYLFFAIDEVEAKTYGDVVFRFPFPPLSLPVGEYFVTINAISSKQIEVLTDNNEWKPLLKAKLQGNFIY